MMLFLVAFSPHVSGSFTPNSAPFATRRIEAVVMAAKDCEATTARTVVPITDAARLSNVGLHTLRVRMFRRCGRSAPTLLCGVVLEDMCIDVLSRLLCILGTYCDSFSSSFCSRSSIFRAAGGTIDDSLFLSVLLFSPMCGEGNWRIRATPAPKRRNRQ
ncbi:hypothetical protein HD806DRAFT_260077 [Xylariaceae sp. AK1471]|nr:hypothetical protein HD806DRAFT_260077 [Xylariaceae sp. AK1471]